MVCIFSPCRKYNAVLYLLSIVSFPCAIVMKKKKSTGTLLRKKNYIVNIHGLYLANFLIAKPQANPLWL